MKLRVRPSFRWRKDTSPGGLRDRVAGALVGMAAGDALGAHYEFGLPWTTAEPARNTMLGGGPFDWEVGEWTDDTTMAIGIAQAVAKGEDPLTVSAQGVMVENWLSWIASGAKDVGVQTRSVLTLVKNHGPVPLPATTGTTAAWAASEHHLKQGRSGGNGSLMRCAPLALCYPYGRASLAEAAALVSKLTHFDDEAADACVLWCYAINHAVVSGEISMEPGLAALALMGVPQERQDLWVKRLDRAAISYPEDFKNNGWVVEAFQGAWSAVSFALRDSTNPFRTGVIEAVNGGNDTDTVAAIAGGLLGAAYGASAVPDEWSTVLHGYPGMSGEALGKLALQVYDSHAKAYR